MLTQEIKDRWVAALRSGKYKQGRGTLCSYDGLSNERSFCCLGVLADLIDPEGWKVRSYVSLSWRDPSCTTDLKQDTLDLDPQRKLIWMNDVGDTFADIADYIEAHLQVLS